MLDQNLHNSPLAAGRRSIARDLLIVKNKDRSLRQLLVEMGVDRAAGNPCRSELARDLLILKKDHNSQSLTA